MENKEIKPMGYWTKELCQIEALKYNTKSEFREGNNSVYVILCRNGWLDELCSHMSQMRKTKIFWTKENCQIEALKYTSRTEFLKCSRSAYRYASENKILNDVCSHMNERFDEKYFNTKNEICRLEALKYSTRNDFKMENNIMYRYAVTYKILNDVCSHMTIVRKKWSKEECVVNALKYNKKVLFKNNDGACYSYALKYGWLDEICSHMKGNFYYTDYDLCKEEALKYNSRSEFQKKNHTAYKNARINGWLDEICSHMIPQGSLKDRYVYAFEFIETKHVYIGLTWNLNNREQQHLNIANPSAVFKFIQKMNNPKYIFKQLGYYDVKTATVKEGEFLDYYKNNGWTILNKARTGGVGAKKGKVWTIDACKEEASKYDGRNLFKIYSSSAYKYAKKLGILNEISPKVPRKSYWAKENCQEEALKYTSRTEFIKGSNGAYNSARKNGWLDDICSHMIQTKKPNGYWTKEKCKEEASKYNTKNEYFINNKASYHSAWKNGWLYNICSHMNNGNKLRWL